MFSTVTGGMAYPGSDILRDRCLLLLASMVRSSTRVPLSGALGMFCYWWCRYVFYRYLAAYYRKLD